MKKNSNVRFFAVTLLFVLLAALPTVNAQTSANVKVSAEFGNYFEIVKKLNPTVKDFHKMNPGEVYGLPNNQTDHLEAGDTEGIWGRELRKWNELRLDPVTSGQPYVNGGISPDNPEQLQRQMDNQAKFMSRGRGYAERISAIQKGRIYGEGLVGYLDQGFQPRKIDEPGVPAYQATYRFSNGEEETFQSLMGCMNPIEEGIGQARKGYTFVQDSENGGVVVPLKTVNNDKDNDNTDLAFIATVGGVGLFFLALLGGVGFVVMKGRKSNLTTDENFVEPVEKPKRIRKKREVVKIKFLGKTARKGSEVVFDGDPNKYEITKTEDGFNFKRKKTEN